MKTTIYVTLAGLPDALADPPRDCPDAARLRAEGFSHVAGIQENCSETKRRVSHTLLSTGVELLL